MKKFKLLLVVPFFLVSLNSALANHKLNNYEQKMVNKIWITTNAINENKQDVPSADKNVNGFFGLAKYNVDGTFKMYTQEGKEKLAGNWSISNDGKERTIIAKDKNGKTLFTRVVDNVAVENDTYTYRIYPDNNNKNIYFDIVHKPLSYLIKD